MAATLTRQLRPLFKAADDLQSGRFVEYVHKSAARTIQKEGLDQIEAAIGADRSISNYRGRLYPRYKIKRRELEVAFVPSGLAEIVEYGNRYGGGPKNKSPIAKTDAKAPRLWQIELAKEWAYRVR